MSRRLINIPGTLQNYTDTRSPLGHATSGPDGDPINVLCRIDALGASGTLLGETAEEQSRWRALIVSDVAPTQHHRLTAKGLEYDLVGEPWAVTDHRGRHHHYESNVRKR